MWKKKKNILQPSSFTTVVTETLPETEWMKEMNVGVLFSEHTPTEDMHLLGLATDESDRLDRIRSYQREYLDKQEYSNQLKHEKLC